MKLSEAFRRDRSNEGKTFDIPFLSGETITLRHAQSDYGRAGRSVMQSRFPELMAYANDPVEKARRQDRILADALAYLVVGWSFDDECTRATAADLLFENPELMEWVDEISTGGDNFFTTASPGSASTPAHGRGSKGGRQKTG